MDKSELQSLNPEEILTILEKKLLLSFIYQVYKVRIFVSA